MYAISTRFVRDDAVRPPLEPTYSGPFRVTRRISDRVFELEIKGEKVTISVEQLKPAHLPPAFTDLRNETDSSCVEDESFYEDANDSSIAFLPNYTYVNDTSNKSNNHKNNNNDNASEIVQDDRRNGLKRYPGPSVTKKKVSFNCSVNKLYTYNNI